MNAISTQYRFSIIILSLVMAVLQFSAQGQLDRVGLGDRASDPINTMCPVTTEEAIDPAFTVEYEGQTIGFCCRRCKTKFEADSQAYLDQLPMLQRGSLASQPAVTHDEHEEGHQDAEPGDHDEEESHDHATDHGKSESGISKLIAWLGKFHPPTTHLPIGMLIGAAFAEGLFILTKRDFFRSAGTFCVAFAAVGSLAAVTLGWFNGGFSFTDDDWIQTVHRWLGTSTAVLTVLSVAMLFRASKPSANSSARLLYRVTLFAAAGMVSMTGFFGGALVYGINHYAW